MIAPCADVRDTALNERDYWREQCGMMERLRDEETAKHEAEIAALNAKLDEALQLVAAMSAERRRVA